MSIGGSQKLGGRLSQEHMGRNVACLRQNLTDFIQCGAPKVAKLVNITTISMDYGTQITVIIGVYENQLITFGGPTLHKNCL